MANGLLTDDLIMRGVQGSTAEDIDLSNSFSKMAKKEEQDPQADYGRLKKLWCEAALIAPTPENLAGCARGNYGAFFSASNSQITQIDAAKTSLGYVRAGLEIAGVKNDLSDDFRSSIKQEALCLFAIANETDRPDDCPAPYDR